MNFSITNCKLCPRGCGADRTKGTTSGYCGGGKAPKLARVGLHRWEEPPISGERGSGTVFFTGCALGCRFCQNHQISGRSGLDGATVSVERLGEIFLELQSQGAENINLVTAGHYLPWVVQALKDTKDKLGIPVVYNSGGYETVEAVRALAGYVDVWLPDLKFFSKDLASAYANAPDYFSVATAAIQEMYRQAGEPVMEDRRLKRGVLVRHLVLPGGRKDSLAIMDWLGLAFKPHEIMVSLMSQYTPYMPDETYPVLNRRTATFEYESVCKRLEEYGFEGFTQQRSSAKEMYTPKFDFKG